MVARYAPPISYNFLNLIRLDGNAKTIFEQVILNHALATSWLLLHVLCMKVKVDDSPLEIPFFFLFFV